MREMEVKIKNLEKSLHGHEASMEQKQKIIVSSCCQILQRTSKNIYKKMSSWTKARNIVIQLLVFSLPN